MMYFVVVHLLFVVVLTVLGHSASSTEHLAGTPAYSPSQRLPGPCPNFSTVGDLDVTKLHTFWYGVYRSQFEDEPKFRCTTSNFTILPDKSIVSLFNGFLEGQREVFELNVTLTPVTAFPGTYNISYDSPDDFLEGYRDAKQKMAYFLGTDYDTFIYHGCCYGDGVNYHKLASSIAFHQKVVPSEVINDSYGVFRHFGFPLNLYPQDQSNCTLQNH